MFGRMLAVAHEVEEAVVAVEDFQRLVEGAAAADVFAVWPFRGSNAGGTNMVTAEFYFPDIIHSASLLQRFDVVFPYMELLFGTVSASTLQPNSSPCLHEALSLLAEVHNLSETSQETKQGIERLMGQWGIMRVPIANDVGVWSSEPQPSRIGSDSRETVLWVVGSLHAQRTPTCDCSSSAVQQLVAVPSQPFPVPADAPKVLHLLPFCSSSSAFAVLKIGWLHGPVAHGKVCCSKPSRTAGPVHSHAVIASHRCINVSSKKREKHPMLSLTYLCVCVCVLCPGSIHC